MIGGLIDESLETRIARALARHLSLNLLVAVLLVIVSAAPQSRAWAETVELTQLRSKLQQLQKANSVTLMLVPYRTSTVVPIDRSLLPPISCIYEMGSRAGIGELLDLLGVSIFEFTIDPEPHVDLRVGIVFKLNGGVLQEFYLDDSGGFRNVSGFSHDHRIMAAPDLPNRLRELVLRNGAVLTKDHLSRCSRS